MQWSDGPGAGFTTDRPWLRLAPDAATRNVAVQATDRESVLATYLRLLTFRRTTGALHRGAMRRLDSGDPDVLAWTRGAGQEALLILVNFVGEERPIDLGAVAPGRWRAQVGTHRDPAEGDARGRLVLRPDEAVILARADG